MRGYKSNVSVNDVGLHICFVFIHENLIFAQCLFVNVNLFLYCLVFPSCVSGSVRDGGRERASVCMHAHTFCRGAVFRLLSRAYRSHFLLGGGWGGETKT